MPSDVIRVCVRYEAPRLAPANVNAKLSGRQEESGVVMEHALIFLTEAVVKWRMMVRPPRSHGPFSNPNPVRNRNLYYLDAPLSVLIARN
jgi:hypothetical protein